MTTYNKEVLGVVVTEEDAIRVTTAAYSRGFAVSPFIRAIIMHVLDHDEIIDQIPPEAMVRRRHSTRSFRKAALAATDE